MSKLSSFLKNHRKGSIIVLVAVLLVGIVGGVFATQRGKQANSQPETNVTVLAQSDLDQIITTKGTIQSTLEHTVYTLLNYKVQEVAVEVGDAVAPGDLLAQLDTADVEKTIADLRDSIETVQSQDSAKISQAQKSLVNAKDQKAIDADKYQDAIDEAAKDIEDLKHQANDSASGAAGDLADAAVASDDRVVNARAVQTAAQSAMNTQNALVNDYVAKRNSGSTAVVIGSITYDTTDSDPASTDGLVALDALIAAERAELDILVQAYDDAVNAYDDTFEEVEDDIWDDEYQEAYDDQFDTFASAFETKYDQYDQAVLNFQAANRSNDLTIQSQSNQLTNQKLLDTTATYESQLATAETNLTDATITSPVAGTVTEVIASIGNRANGALFVIQDTQSLEISTTIPEYDIPLISEGQAVRFTTDATGGDEFEGTVELIAPTAMDTDGDFEVIVRIDTPDPRLRIGMNAKLTIVLESRKAVFAVPYDAITINDAGQNVVTALREDGVTRYEIPVDVGMETDYFVEISGSDLTAGLTILNDPLGKNVVTTVFPGGSTAPAA